jgi:hypothetical protein
MRRSFSGRSAGGGDGRAGGGGPWTGAGRATVQWNLALMRERGWSREIGDLPDHGPLALAGATSLSVGMPVISAAPNRIRRSMPLAAALMGPDANVTARRSDHAG